jgi:GT2 family glycosyltransferase
MAAANRKIAALLTCHNRREKTLSCLDNLLSQVGIDASIEVFLVDDGSNDGTAAAVAESYPSVHLLQGDGSLYWTGGMRMAMQAASAKAFDFYLWLNDDTRLYPDAVARLLQTHVAVSKSADAPPIVIGSICDPKTHELTYGGSIRVSRWHPLRFRHLEISSLPQECDVFNGNCVLLPSTVVEVVGSLDPALVHAAGDYEYGLRARKTGITSWVAPGFFGECSTNSLRGTWYDPQVPLWQRYKKLFSIKGQPPGPRFVYYYRHGGPFWFALYPLIYLRPLAATMKKLFSRR